MGNYDDVHSACAVKAHYNLISWDFWDHYQAPGLCQDKLSKISFHMLWEIT
ncbi:hypothetical protein APHNP_0863 [Anaplasma phagocytophilum str. ApNP]|uniref:Uncharacterized protein n=2 Tax=Anaplasma phagocytophilum TaxID=948 RepID=A0A0F3NKM3_ANAPH|nr:hypothetical protein APHMUC_1073 [Anaplasma phagocytophilum str. ApMUC09]KJV67464.1 hypothetical protein APHNP_0863 [Anaplasma phagocytophilum str. ApNP]